MTALRYTLRALGFALLVAIVVYVPFRISDFRASEFALIGIYFIAILGLNVLTGYTGMISLGHGAFMALGAYTTAILVADHGMRDLWTIPLAGLLAAAAGAAFGLPALRLSGPYLALATFGIAVATPIVIKKFDGLTGGSGGINLFEAEGITGLPEFLVTLPGGKVLSFNDWLYYLTWTIALVLFAVAWGIHHSRFGRSLRAIRDNEIAAAASGVWLASHKTLAFTISAFYAGVAGVAARDLGVLGAAGRVPRRALDRAARRPGRGRDRVAGAARGRRGVPRLPPAVGPGHLQGAGRPGGDLRRGADRPDDRAADGGGRSRALDHRPPNFPAVSSVLAFRCASSGSSHSRSPFRRAPPRLGPPPTRASARAKS